jgi:hypothetical protein
MIADEAMLERGRAQGRVEVLLRQLAVRFGPVDARVADRVCLGSEQDMERWVTRVLSAASVAEVLGDE